ncbi:siderophore-interacting protein [Mycolicibacterium sp. 018/SC-01/001]|uniref:siderophore-interacting protein n=1 Tax=Mycolicibacterium sp. 018/SC-01/001 TaxID=2592069 RepID=UPI0011807386|nr:siderophore-interacting protein [Mycolicibacterium sp. 018/SC-01/001]TRW79688.1 siderophore-interacting protein [Mycolicibacterium sp. 018/SC-01/001]
MSHSYASVIDSRALSSRLRRIVLHVDDPEALQVRPDADSAVGVYFSPRDHPDGEGRNYSVRHQAGALLTVDIAVHRDGPGSAWARTATPGQRVILDHARAWYRPPADARWQLVVTDLSGLPAAARIIEELPSNRPAIVVAEVLTADDLAYLPRRDDVTVLPYLGTGNGLGPSVLAHAVRAVPMPPSRGYCWFAGEAAESRAVRKYLRSLGWQRDDYDITGYWRVDSERWDARFEEAGDEALIVYERALAAGKDEKVAFEEFDEVCERIGL